MVRTCACPDRLAECSVRTTRVSGVTRRTVSLRQARYPSVPPGVSGNLVNNNLVMYDRETESEWKQPLGEAINGPLDEQTLDVVTASMMSWQRFLAEYPDGIVLQPVNGGDTDPQRGSLRPAEVHRELQPVNLLNPKRIFPNPCL